MENSENEWEIVAKLRHAAEAKDAYSCRMVIRELAKLLGRRFMVECAINQLRKLLPEIEQYHPRLRWIDEWAVIAYEFNPVTYQSLREKLYLERSNLNYPVNTLDAIDRYLRSTLEDLDLLIDDYHLGHQGHASMSISFCFEWLFQIHDVIYQHLHCPERYVEYMGILNLEGIIGFKMNELNQATIEEYMTVQRAWRKCRDEMPYTFWFEVADDIEKRLRA